MLTKKTLLITIVYDFTYKISNGLHYITRLSDPKVRISNIECIKRK